MYSCLESLHQLMYVLMLAMSIQLPNKFRGKSIISIQTVTKIVSKADA